MAMMAKMRSLAPWFILTVGGLFVLFMVLSDSSITQLATRGSNVVGYIDGDEVTYQEFSDLVERFRTQQVQSTGQEIEPDQMDRFRDQVWETLINQKIIQKKIDEYGITVTDAEIKDALLGPNPPPELTANFIDSIGQFDRNAYESAILNPANKDIVIRVEEGIRQQLYQSKLQNYLNASVLVSDAEVLKDFQEKNIAVNADYAFVNSRFMADSLFQISESEIEEFYNNNKEDYKVEEQRKIKYVLFKTVPSSQDTIDIEQNLKAIIGDLKEDTSSFKTFVEIYSDQPYSQDTLTLDKIDQNIYNELEKSEPGDIIGPVLTNQGYIVALYLDKLTGDDEIVRASHILISNRERTPERAEEIADSLYRELKAGLDFEATAKEISEDPGSGANGGDLGWFGKGQMVGEFEEAAFSGKIGEVQKPVKTRYGSHIIKTTAKSKEKYVIERIINKIEPSGTTYDRLYNNASDFSYLSDKNGFDSEAELMNYDVVESAEIKEETNMVPGLGTSKPLTKFVFENSVGAVSQVFKVPSGYVVAMVSEIKPAGYKPLEEVKDQVERKLMENKKLDKTYEIAKEIKEKIGDGDNFGAAQSVFPRVKISNVNNFTANGTIPGVGRDSYFNAYCFSGQLKKMSDAIRGERGSYLIKVNSKSKFDSTAFAIQKINTRNMLLQQKQSAYFTTWLNNIKDQIEIEDLRYKFYR